MKQFISLLFYLLGDFTIVGCLTLSVFLGFRAQSNPLFLSSFYQSLGLLLAVIAIFSFRYLKKYPSSQSFPNYPPRHFWRIGQSFFSSIISCGVLSINHPPDTNILFYQIYAGCMLLQTIYEIFFRQERAIESTPIKASLPLTAKNLLLLFPYFLTNLGSMLFFIVGGFLARDFTKDPSLLFCLQSFAAIFGLSFLGSALTYMAEGIVPKAFKNGIRQGFFYLGKSSLFIFILFFPIHVHKAPSLEFRFIWYWFWFFVATLLTVYEQIQLRKRIRLYLK
jgi:hypothetical protein